MGDNYVDISKTKIALWEYAGKGMKAKNMLCFFSPLCGREDEGQKQSKLPEMFLIF